MIGYILMLILWATISLTMMVNAAPHCAEKSKTIQVAVFIILLFGGPIIMIAALIEAILALFLPEGWDDDDANSS